MDRNHAQRLITSLLEERVNDPVKATVPRDATMTEAEFMDLVGIASRATAWAWARRGIGPTRYVIDRRTARYSHSEVRAWLLAGAKRKPSPTRTTATTVSAALKGGDVCVA